MRKQILIVAACLLAGTAVPVSAVECDGFLKSIDTSLKLIAMSRAEAIGDNSAPRATLRTLEIANELQLISINVSLMTSNRCTLPSEPIHTGKYLLNALKCSTERIKGVADSPLCDTSKWVGDEEKKESEKRPDEQ